MNTCVLIPTCYRPHGLTRALSTLTATAPDVYICVATEPDDIKGQRIARAYGATVAICPEPMAGAPAAWNTALVAVPDCDSYFTGADDVSFFDGWLDHVLAELDFIGGNGLVGINDKYKDAQRRGYATHYLMTRRFIIDHHGGVAAIPHYRADYTDVEACKRAQRAGMYGYADKAIVQHHWEGNSNTPDKCYVRAKNFRTQARSIYQKREAAGFPDDFPPILKG